MNGDSPPVFRSSVTTIDPVWLLLLAVLAWLVFKR